MSMLSAERLSVQVGGVRRVSQVSFTADPGQATGLVGPSGAGKSTLARALVGLEPELHGSLMFEGEQLVGASARAWRRPRRAIQLVWQSAAEALDPRRTALESLAEARALAGLLPDAALLEARAAELELDPDLLTHRPWALSGGQRQRVGLARALVAEPRLLIADEITAGVDRVVAWRIIDHLRRIRDQGVGILIITHDVALLADWVDELLVLDRGAVVERGPYETLAQDGTHPVTRALLSP
jgi:peptide/nickel transport system ATP-binding protein